MKTSHCLSRRYGACAGLAPGFGPRLRAGRVGHLLAAAAAAVGLLPGSLLAVLVVTPGTDLTSSGLFGGPFNPPSAVYRLKNEGAAPLVWTAAKNQAWVSLSAYGGSIPPGESAQLQVFFNALALELGPGTYQAQLTITDGSTGSSITRGVSLTIGTPGPGTWAFGSAVAPNQLEVRVRGLAGAPYELLETTNVVQGPWFAAQAGTLVGGEASYVTFSEGKARFFRASSTEPNSVSIRHLQLTDRNLVIVTGDPFGTYALDASPDGSSWTPVLTNRTGADGTFTYSTTQTNLQYRVRALATAARPVLDQILIVGESLAAALDGRPALSTTPSPMHLRFYADSSSTNVAPLREAVVETMASGAAQAIGPAAPGRRVIISNVGASDSSYATQKRGTANFALGIHQFQTAPHALAHLLLSCRPRAVFAVAGNGGHDWNDPNYGLSMRQWQADYQTEIQRVTGVTDPIPMFHSQISEWTCPIMGSNATAVSPYALLAEAEANPTKTVLVCPRYMLPHAVEGADFPGVHLSNEGNRWLGEYYAKAYKKVVVDGQTWTPLKPRSITRNGAVITAVFDVPVPPLVLDTTLVSNPGNYGFEFTDDSGSPPAITQVQITGPDSVTITLSRVPTGANQRLRYAYTGVPGNPAGPTTGPRGNLRDSDSTPSLFGYTLYNWCVHFDKPVN